jgi:hypothetical protein
MVSSWNSFAITDHKALHFVVTWMAQDLIDAILLLVKSSELMRSSIRVLKQTASDSLRRSGDSKFRLRGKAIKWRSKSPELTMGF